MAGGDDNTGDALRYLSDWERFAGSMVVVGSISANRIRAGAIKVEEIGKAPRYINHDYLDPSLEDVHRKVLPEPTFCFYCLRERGERDSNCRGCGGAHFLTRAALARRSRS